MAKKKRKASSPEVVAAFETAGRAFFELKLFLSDGYAFVVAMTPRQRQTLCDRCRAVEAA